MVLQMKKESPVLVFIMSLILLAFTQSCITAKIQWPNGVEKALELAGGNRAELEKVLIHYMETGDSLKQKAAEFLIENMPDHGYAKLAFYDPEGNEAPFDIADYKNYKEALDAFHLIQQARGELNYQKKEFIPDLEVITAEFLIENIDFAFKAWKEKPWAKKLSFEAMCEYVLPYRESNEPLNAWRRAWMFKLINLERELENSSDSKLVSAAAWKDIGKWLRFNQIYYLHPTDQGFDEMTRTGLGRCEDLANMAIYAMRSQGVAATSDYTPFWADRDNNHAWQVVLDENGHGKGSLSSRAAKIYRKTFATQQDSLACIKSEEETVPRWLSKKTYKDVTAQYLETTDVTITLDQEKPEGLDFAYICVFNGGDWKAIHWGEIQKGMQVTFTDMGRDIAYLPAFYDGENLLPAGAPFILTKAGEVQPLSPDSKETIAIEISTVKPDQVHSDTLEITPCIQVKPGKKYELFFWNNRAWESLGLKEAGEDPVSFEKAPAGGLYWLVAEGSRRLERIFTLDGGRQIWW